MKKWLIIFSIIFCSILFSGCSLISETKGANQESSETLKVTGEVNKTFYEEKEVNIARDAIQSAEKILGILNVSKSNFEISLIDSEGNQETYFLWLRKGDSGGMIMNIEDTHTGYTLQEKDVAKLKDLLFVN
jgi:outer membrane murein-binding lipoprotein Lpp